MTDRGYFSVADAANSALPDPHLGNRAYNIAQGLVGKILSQPHLGSAYLQSILDERGIPTEDISAENITEQLLSCVHGKPLAASYLQQLMRLAADHPDVKENPHLLLPDISLEAQALSHPHPDTEITHAQAREALVNQARLAGL